MTDANLAQDTGDTVIAQEDGGGKTRWLMRSNDGQFYLRDSDDNTELLNPEDAEKVYGELSNKHVAFEEAFKHHKP
jgi:hypothetical protein